MKGGDNIGIDKKKWRNEQTKMYNFRLMYDTGIPEALENAIKKTGETQALYIKKSLVMRLRQEGFLSQDEIVLNKTEQRHIDYIKQKNK